MNSVFGSMLAARISGVADIVEAQVGDKTLMEALVAADEAYRATVAGGASFPTALGEMAHGADRGRDSTKDLVAKLSLTFDDLRNINPVIAVAGGEGKVLAILGALRTKCIGILIVDEATAPKVISLDRKTSTTPAV